LSFVSTRWSPYFSRCTCWNQHFPILNGITRCSSHVTPRCLFSCPTFWKLSGFVLPPVVSFFGGLFTRVEVCFTSNRHSFEYCTSTFSFMCRSRGKHLVINSSYHTNISFVIDSFSHTLHTCLGLPHPTIAHLSQC